MSPLLHYTSSAWTLLLCKAEQDNIHIMYFGYKNNSSPQNVSGRLFWEALINDHMKGILSSTSLKIKGNCALGV